MQLLTKWEQAALCFTSLLFLKQGFGFQDEWLRLSSICVGIASFLNYAFYTGRKNIISYVDWALVYTGGLLFLWRSLQNKQQTNVFLVGLTLSTYLQRQRAGHQLYVHLVAYFNMLIYQLYENYADVNSKQDSA